MAYTLFNGALPDGASQAGTAFGQSTRDNLNALRDACVMAGSFTGWNETPSGGTESQPAQVLSSKGTERVKVAITWGTTGGEAGNPTVYVFSYSNDSGSTYSTIGTLTIAYTSNSYFNGSTWS